MKQKKKKQNLENQTKAEGGGVRGGGGEGVGSKMGNGL